MACRTWRKYRIKPHETDMTLISTGAEMDVATLNAQLALSGRPTLASPLPELISMRGGRQAFGPNAEEHLLRHWQLFENSCVAKAFDARMGFSTAASTSSTDCDIRHLSAARMRRIAMRKDGCRFAKDRLRLRVRWPR